MDCGIYSFSPWKPCANRLRKLNEPAEAVVVARGCRTAVGAVSLALQLQVVVEVVGLLFVRELVERVDRLAVVPLAVADVLRRAHDRDVELAVAGADLVPVDEVDVGELAAVKDAVLDRHRLAAAEEDAAEMAVGVHAREVAGLVDVAAELRVDRAGVAVLVLFLEVGNELAHDVEQVVLEVLEVERVDVVRAFLNHDGAGRVVRGDADGAVLDARGGDDFADFLRDVVEGGDPAPRLKLEFLLVDDEFHGVFS